VQLAPGLVVQLLITLLNNQTLVRQKPGDKPGDKLDRTPKLKPNPN
jgi:hypothetical protein